MKKTLAIILSLVMVFALLPVAAFAENGPKPYNSDDYYTAYVMAYEIDSDGNYAGVEYTFFDTDPEAEFDELDGLLYDVETNTLYLDSLEYPELVLETNAMGDDFVIYVTGICSVASIEVWGDYYGGCVRFDGPGKLVVNADGYSSFGILANCEETESAITFGDKVTVEAYGEDFTVGVIDTPIKEAMEALIFENGEEHDLYTYDPCFQNVEVMGFMMLDPDELEEPQSLGCVFDCEDDPEGLYIGSYMEGYDEDGNPITIYFIAKYVYLEDFDSYFPDFGAIEGGMYILDEDSLEEFGFTMQLDDEDNPVEFINDNPYMITYYMLGLDDEGNCYGVGYDYDYDLDDYVYAVYDLIDVGLEDIYYVELNEDVYYDDLSPVTEYVEPDPDDTVLYEHYVDEEAFIYRGTAFPDVNEGDWYDESVMYNAYKGYITGYKNGSFGPADQLQRQDFVVILARIAQADLSQYTSCALRDVDMNAYYGPSVAWAVDAGIIKGYNNGNFGVGDPITREQVCTMLYRYMGSPAVSDADSILSGFNDKDSISPFAKDAIAWAVANGIIKGKTATTVAPLAFASRAEIATIVMRMDQAGLFGI